MKPIVGIPLLGLYLPALHSFYALPALFNVLYIRESRKNYSEVT